MGTDSTIVGEKANCPSAIYFPSAFTPNNDGLNDIFQATVFGRWRSFKMDVYDRFGELIFSTTDYKKVWDGKIKGMPGSVGVYVWVCCYELEGGKPAFEKGKVKLIR